MSAGLPAGPERRGIVFLLSAPSGAGKTTLLSAFRGRADLGYSVSCTTRPPREGEVDGRDYFFIGRDEFEERERAGDFLESAEVHGNRYGTPRGPLLAQVEAGRDVVVDVDVQGAAAIRANAGDVLGGSLVDVFLLPADLGVVRRRLAGRGSEGAEAFELRMRNAAEEMRRWREYAYAIVSGTPEEDRARFGAIVEAERCRAARLVMPGTFPEAP